MKHKNKRKIKNRRTQVHSAKKGAKKKNRKSFSPQHSNNKHDKNERIVSISDITTGNTYQTVLLLEYSMLFPGESIDILETIKNFSRERLIKIVFFLVKRYGLCRLSDMETTPFFSYNSELQKDRKKRISVFLRKQGYLPDMVSYAGERTLLELLKMIYSISPNECTNKYEDSIAEVKLFDVLLAINEQKINYRQSTISPNNLAETLFTGLYAQNEFSNFDGSLTLAEQLYYAYNFFEFITSRNEYKKIYDCFLKIFEIENWQDYYRTIAIIAAQSIKGIGLFSYKRNDSQNLLNHNVLNYISIDEYETITVCDNVDKNRNFSKFRSCPLIKMSNGEFMIYNQKLIVERLYNSIYFDLLPYKKDLKYKGKEFDIFFKEVFIEKYLFDKTMLSCMDENRIDVCFPKQSNINHNNFVDLNEDDDQPDFYIREKNAALIFECKAIKLNGDLKQKADVDEIFDELRNKILIKNWNKRKGEKQYISPKKVGIGQLVAHINRLETRTFKWDSPELDDVVYYPILVLESDEIVQPPLSSKVNEWYDELLSTNPTVTRYKCQPIIVMTIKTLFFYNDLFYERGFRYFFDLFLSECKFENNSKQTMSMFATFDSWMTSKFQANKKCYYDEILKKL